MRFNKKDFATCEHMLLRTLHNGPPNCGSLSMIRHAVAWCQDWLTPKCLALALAYLPKTCIQLCWGSKLGLAPDSLVADHSKVDAYHSGDGAVGP